MKNKTNIVLAGVGGHGVITAANILGKAAVAAQKNVYVSEVHGMAQRGGSVNCTVRIGNVSGPLIPNGEADAIISTEPVEALRNISYSNKKTIIITDSTPLVPFTVSTGQDTYPKLEKVFTELEKYAKLYKFNAVKEAKKAGSILTKNTVMLGALAALEILPFDKKILLDTILENVPSKYKEINKKAFENGYNSIKK